MDNYLGDQVKIKNTAFVNGTYVGKTEWPISKLQCSAGHIVAFSFEVALS